MDTRDPQLPVATLRPRRIAGRMTSLRGALGRWFKTKVVAGLHGRHAPFVLTAIVFSGMMLAMGYVADRANRAADAIDEAHRVEKARMAYEHARDWAQYDLEVAEHEAATPVDPWPTASQSSPPATPLFYVRGR
jgi:hypothetical protein